MILNLIIQIQNQFIIIKIILMRLKIKIIKFYLIMKELQKEIIMIIKNMKM